MEAAKDEADRPFPQEQEDAEKSARLKELINILLNMDEKDNTLIDGEPDMDDNEPKRIRAWNGNDLHICLPLVRGILK